VSVCLSVSVCVCVCVCVRAELFLGFSRLLPVWMLTPPKKIIQIFLSPQSVKEATSKISTTSVLLCPLALCGKTSVTFFAPSENHWWLLPSPRSGTKKIGGFCPLRDQGRKKSVAFALSEKNRLTSNLRRQKQNAHGD